MELLSDRDRFLRTMRYQAVDRVPYHETPLWGQTIDRWYSEGMPPAERDDALLGPMGLYAGSTFFGLDRREYVDIRLDAQPPYSEELLEETERYRVFVDNEGVTRKALKTGESRGTRSSMDTFVGFPASDRDAWVQFKKRFNPKTPLRYPKNWQEKVRVWRQRDYVLVLPLNSIHAFGLFSWLRRCMGTVQACTIFYDDPAFGEELLGFYTDFTMETIHEALHDLQFDYFNIFEDMAGKGGPLIAPDLMRRYMLPCYRRFIDFLHQHGVEFVSLDSDGDIRVLIPLLMEAGVNLIWPLEVAAGMEPLELRKEFGRDLRLSGGIDKRELARGKTRADIDCELLRKVPALIEDGGYIPTLDHDVPPDVPYDNYLYYLEVKRRIAEGGLG